MRNDRHTATMFNLTFTRLTRTTQSGLLLALFWGLQMAPSWGQLVSDESVVREWNETLLHAIRNDLARPTVHARNLHHWSMAVYDAWAAYDTIAEPYLIDVNLPFVANDNERAVGPRNGHELRLVPAALESVCEHARRQRHPRNIYQRFACNGGVNSFASTDYLNDGPRALGNYIAEQVLAFGDNDGSNEANDYANQHYEPVNPDLFIESVPGNPFLVQPNKWQSISLTNFVGQSGVVETETPPFLSPEWGNVTPFGLPDSVKTPCTFADGWPYSVWMDQGTPPLVDLNYADGIERPLPVGHSMVLRWSEHLDPTDGVMVDISPATMGNVDPALFDLNYDEYDQFYNWEDGGDASVGRAINPKTGQPYEPQIVPRGDYGRVLAEFWADGPDSETPPGHWYTILNTVMDHPEFVPKWKGEGPTMSAFDWTVCAYFTLGGALHDAAIAAWSHKGWYDYIRPVSALRWMQGRGQCTDPNLPNFDNVGLPLVPGFCEIVEAGDPDFPSPPTSTS